LGVATGTQAKLALALVAILGAGLVASPSASADARAAAPACHAVDTTGEPTAGKREGPAAPRYFGPGFPTLHDDLWGYPVGGFGGLGKRVRPNRTPVVFVHGNQADASNWLDVMQQFQNDAHYTMADMFALSYNGLENAAAGQPDRVSPTTADRDYLRQNPQASSNGGHGSADDDEVLNLCRFIEAVQAYTHSQQIDIVAHSLGVTLARDTMRRYPSLARDVVAFVGIAGGNHGTSICRGLQNSYYGCNELVPGSPWLARLNGRNGSLETPGPTKWMTIYDGSVGDPYFNPPDDEQSPRLKGAINVTFPGTYHNDLRVDPAEVDTYLPFLLRVGQAGPFAARDGATLARRITRTKPDGLHGRDLCGVPKLTGPVAGCSY
jgi:pimeloyl-ACP methyl ester carboxylesterase